MTVYAPTPAEIVALAHEHPELRPWDPRDGLGSSLADWAGRCLLTTPGPVWTLPSDTCMTGRLHAPRHVAYDASGAEFVYRQPDNSEELTALMKAASVETFACYRFDGIERWTRSAVDGWLNLSPVIDGWLTHSIAAVADPEILAGLHNIQEYRSNPDFRSYIREFRALLR